MTKELHVSESEWADKGYSLWLDGIEGDVYFDSEDADWKASVKPSSERCEFPELFGFKVFGTEKDALAWAEETMRKADGRYQHVRY